MKLPKLREHAPSGRAYVECKNLFNPPRRYLGKIGSEEAKLKYAQVCARLATLNAGRETARPIHPQATTVEHVVGASLDHYKRMALGKRDPKRTEYSNLRAAAKPLLALHRHTRAVDFGPPELEEVRAAMVAKGWAREHINAQVNRVRRFFKRAVAKSLCSPDVLTALLAVAPLRRGETAARETPPKRPVAWKDVERVLPFISPHVADLVRVQWFTGARSDELTAMETADIDRSGDVWTYEPAHKMDWLDLERVVCFGPRAQAVLKPWLTPGFVFSPAKGLASLGRTRKRLVERYTATSYRQAVMHGFRKLARSLGAKMPDNCSKEVLLPALAKLEITYWHPHLLRHSLATLVRDKWGLEAAEAAIGDRAEATARYAEKSRRLAIEIAREIG